jgi:hypothetical protein
MNSNWSITRRWMERLVGSSGDHRNNGSIALAARVPSQLNAIKLITQ